MAGAPAARGDGRHLARAAFLLAALRAAVALDPAALRQQLAIQDREAGAKPLQEAKPLQLAALNSQQVPAWQAQGLAPPSPVDPSEPLTEEAEAGAGAEELPSPLAPPGAQLYGSGNGPVPPSMDPLDEHSLMLSAQATQQHKGAKQPLPGRGENPLLTQYRSQTVQYEKDAEEAAKSAAMYAQMTKEAVDGGTVESQAHSLGGAEMNRIGVGLWAHAAWEFEKLLRDNRAALQAKAAKAASAPFKKAAAAYEVTQGEYDAASQEYSDRALEQGPYAQKLMSYANQYRLQGDEETAETYENQAHQLMGQAENFANIAKEYYQKAVEINNLFPMFRKQGKTAGKFAKFLVYKKKPIAKEQLFPFTIVPPIEFVQTGHEVHEQSASGPHPRAAADSAFLGR